MEARNLLETLLARGIVLSVGGADLNVDHSGELTDADRNLIRAHKPSLLRLLSESASAAMPQSNLDLVVARIARTQGVTVAEVDGGRVIGGCVIQPCRTDGGTSNKAAQRNRNPVRQAGLLPAPPAPAAHMPGAEDQSAYPGARAIATRQAIAAKGDELRMRGEAVRLCWLPEDDREERAAIMEFDGGLSRDAAERAAGVAATGKSTS